MNDDTARALAITANMLVLGLLTWLQRRQIVGPAELSEIFDETAGLLTAGTAQNPQLTEMALFHLASYRRAVAPQAGH